MQSRSLQYCAGQIVRVSTPAISSRPFRNLTTRYLRNNKHVQRIQPVAGLANDMLSGLGKVLGMYSATEGAGTTAGRALGFRDTAPSWEELQQTVTLKQEALQAVIADPATGPPNPHTLRRTFGQPGEPRIKLYRDHAAWCPYCHKVVLQLEEKQIPYVVEKINMRCYGDKPSEFLRKVPSGLLPVLEVDGGKPITESALIAQVLEELYPEMPLLPARGSPERQRADDLLRLERRLFGAWLQWLCNGWGHDSNKAAFVATMDAVEEGLGATPGPYFLEDFSLVDITFAPFLERIAASIAYYKGMAVRGQGQWPNLDRWFAAMETRPAYQGFKSDYYTHCHDLPPQLGGCVMTAEGEPVAAAIDGLDGKSWHLPLPPLSASSLEPHSPGENSELDRLEAAAKLVGNHAAVTKFALRGVGKAGPRPVSAPLADPTAIPGTDWEREVDAALRHVAHALLEGVEAKQESQHMLKGQPLDSLESAGDSLIGAPVIPSLAYLRDRVGVPRDMKFPAARQFRAHLNWAIDALKV